MPKVVLYTKDYCSFCARAKERLKSKGAEFTEIDVTHDAGLQAEMIERSGRQTVPQIFINRRHVGGFDDLAALDAAGGSIRCSAVARMLLRKGGIIVSSFSAVDRRAILPPSMPPVRVSSQHSSPGWRLAAS
ncbi:glutaredoxin 3 [Bradyrhizobium sp. RDT10]